MSLASPSETCLSITVADGPEPLCSATLLFLFLLPSQVKYAVLSPVWSVNPPTHLILGYGFCVECSLATLLAAALQPYSPLLSSLSRIHPHLHHGISKTPLELALVMHAKHEPLPAEIKMLSAPLSLLYRMKHLPASRCQACTSRALVMHAWQMSHYHSDAGTASVLTVQDEPVPALRHQVLVWDFSCDGTHPRPLG